MQNLEVHEAWHSSNTSAKTVFRSRCVSLFKHQYKCSLDKIGTIATYCVYINFNPLRTEVLLSNIQESSSYLTGNTLRFRYKAQQINAV
jgi:hypothetical protein